MRILSVATAIALLAACGGQKAETPTAPTCDLTPDTLAGKTFLAEVAKDGQKTTDSKARIRFDKEGDKLTAKYTVKSLANVFDYTCEATSDTEVKCVTPVRLPELCIALELNKEGGCTVEAMNAIDGVSVTPEEFTKAKADADKLMAQAKEENMWDRFKVAYHNVGNQLQAIVYAKINDRKCNLKIDDMFMTVYQGNRMEDYNPMGSNDFVKVDGEYLFEDCPHQRLLGDMNTAERPATMQDFQMGIVHDAGAEVHFFNVDTNAQKAEESCNYSMDTWANYKPVEKGQAVNVLEDGTIDWHASYAFPADDLIQLPKSTGGVFHMVRYKECGGKKEKVDVICSKPMVQ